MFSFGTGTNTWAELKYDYVQLRVWGAGSWIMAPCPSPAKLEPGAAHSSLLIRTTMELPMMFNDLLSKLNKQRNTLIAYLLRINRVHRVHAFADETCDGRSIGTLKNILYRFQKIISLFDGCHEKTAAPYSVGLFVYLSNRNNGKWDFLCFCVNWSTSGTIRIDLLHWQSSRWRISDITAVRGGFVWLGDGIIHLEGRLEAISWRSITAWDQSNWNQQRTEVSGTDDQLSLSNLAPLASGMDDNTWRSELRSGAHCSRWSIAVPEVNW